MKKTNLYIIALLALFATIASCEKADELSQTDIISSEWRVEEVVIEGTPDSGTDYSGYLFTFNRDFSYSFTVAPTSKVETEGSWVLTNNDKTLLLTGGSGAQISIPIVALNEDRAELEFTIPKTYKSDVKQAIYKLARN